MRVTFFLSRLLSVRESRKLFTFSVNFGKNPYCPRVVLESEKHPTKFELGGRRRDSVNKKLFNSSIDNIKVRPPNRSVIFTLAIPILDWGRSKSQYKKENYTLEAKKLTLENTKNTIIKEIRDIVRTVEESRSRLGIYEKNKEVSVRSYKISQLRFSNGELTNQQLAIEQERLSQVQIEYLNAYITYQMALADLKRKTMWDFQNNRSYKTPVE